MSDNTKALSDGKWLLLVPFAVLAIYFIAGSIISSCL